MRYNRFKCFLHINPYPEPFDRKYRKKHNITNNKKDETILTWLRPFVLCTSFRQLGFVFVIGVFTATAEPYYLGIR